MPHVELSLAELADARPDQTNLERWASAVQLAAEPCLLLDRAGAVVALSPACAELFSIQAKNAVGRRLVDGVLHLLDFNAVSGELPGWDVDKTPPLLAIHTGGLARGLLRVPGEGGTSTVDAISTPIREGDAVVGSLTFFASVRR